MTDNLSLPNETICATATAPGGAIGIVRISGPEAIEIVERIFRPANGKPLSERKANTLIFGRIVEVSDCHSEQSEVESKNPDTIIDEVLVSLFRAPHSYTGEDSVEISCHGSNYILQRVIQLLIENGCRLAKPGEYTQRAFLNGKMDLSQAEAVADLIASTSAANHRIAMNQMRGGFSKELAALRDRLLHITALLELELDFSDHEELEFADRSELNQLADEIERVISRLVQSFSVGNAIKNGIPVAIIGETNAGKSTLLNALVGEERAIVSDIHGTTRDVIEDVINISGITFRFIDTAGIRQTGDEVENLGIRRTFEKLDRAEIVLWLIDATGATEQIARLAPQILPRLDGKQLIAVLNKADLTEASPEVFNGIPLPDGTKAIAISAKTGKGIEELQNLLVSSTRLPNISPNDVIVTNARHVEALRHALEAIHRVQEGLALGLSGDLVSQDLRACIHHLSDIAGEVTPDQVLGSIFKNFCIGK